MSSRRSSSSSLPNRLTVRRIDCDHISSTMEAPEEERPFNRTALLYLLTYLLVLIVSDIVADLFELDDPNWSVIEIPATVTGSHADGYQSEKPIPNVHGAEHNVKTEMVTMGVQVARSVPGSPDAFLINFYQSWTKFAHVFCSIELERVKATGDGDEEEEEEENAGKDLFKFVKGVFHPGFVGLIDEEELEFIGFVESFVVDASKRGEDGDMLPGKWMKRRAESRLYRPGAPGADGRATLVDVEDGNVYPADYLTKKAPNAV